MKNRLSPILLPPLAAKQTTWVVAHLTPKEGEALFDLKGNMTPSKSRLDRLPKQLNSKWEADRERFENYTAPYFAGTVHLVPPPVHVVPPPVRYGS